MDMAVHHYPRDHYAEWDAWLGGHDLLSRPAAFGENIVAEGLTEDAVHIGDRFRLGSALLEISQPRKPCWKIEHHFGRKGMVARIVKQHNCGWYYRVIEEGAAQAGDTLERVEKGHVQWSVAHVFAKFYDPAHKDGHHPVHSILSGKVVDIIDPPNPERVETGRKVVIGHKMKWSAFGAPSSWGHVFTGYLHLHQIGVKKGQSVEGGDVVGTAGATGYTKTVHLHFNCYRHDGKRYVNVNPGRIFKKKVGRFLLPLDKRTARAKVLQWMFFEQYTLEPTIAVRRFWLTEQEEPLSEVQQAQLPDKLTQGHAALAVLEKGLAAGPWLVGDGPTIADIALYGYTHVAPEGGYELDAYPNITGWIGRFRDIPGYLPITQRDVG